DSKLLDELNYIYNYDIKSNDSLQILRVQLLPPQPIPVNSWLFAMFAVGGILVTSFFISILIHMRLYRLRRNHQEEIRRQRTLLDDGTGMRKWTLDKDDIKSLRSFIYPKKTDASKKSTEISILTEIDEKNNSTLTNENSGDKSISSNENSKESTNIPRSLIHKSSIRSNRSTRSTKSTKSTRSQKAIINATSLSESTQNPIILDNRAESPSEDTELEETCAICLEDFDEGDNIRELPCRHWYHVECIDPWLTTKSSSCPLCKKDCKPSIGSESNENTSISVNNENESQGTQAVDVDSSSNSTNANAPNVVLRVGRWFRGYFSSRNGRGDSTRNVTTNSLQNENEIMELESVRSVN
ncbi:9662_t:CDS:1, partial [Scutellospora calospora]